MNRWAVLLGVLLVSIGAAPASAEEGLASVTRMPGQTLSPSRFPGNATVLTAEDIKRSGASTVPELLARQEGVTVLDARGFGLGADSTVNLRGVVNGSRSNILVVVDGVRQNQLTGDEVHWQGLPVDQIERIEILRGGSGVIYGEGALAGVINITTKRSAADPLKVEQGLELGGYGWRKGYVSARGNTEPFRYGLNVTRHTLDGYRDYSSSRNSIVSGHGGVDLRPDLTLDVHVLHQEDTTNSPGGLTPQQSQDRNEQAVQNRVGIMDDATNQFSLDLSGGPYDGVSWLISAFSREREADSLRSGLFTRTPSQGLQFRSDHEWTNGSAHNLLISGFELVDDKATTGTRGAARTDESNREGYGFYLEDTLSLTKRLSLVAGFRYDKSRFEEDIIAFDSNFNEVNYVGTLRFEGKSPKLGVTYALLPETVDVFANYSRPFKSPNVDDFASRSSEFQGNVGLLPQQADAYELGGRAKIGPWNLNATAFSMRIDEEILFVQGIPGNPFLFQNQNHDTRRYGLETAARFNQPRVRGYLTYTFVDAEFRKGQFMGRTVPGTADHTLTSGFGVSPLPDVWVDLDWLLVHDYFRINDISNALPAADNYGVLNLTLAYEFLKPHAGVDAMRGRAFMSVKNLTNEEYTTFQSSNGHTLATGAGENPMPPINVIGGVSLEF